MKNVKIYQLHNSHDAKFMDYEFVKENNIVLKLWDYNLVWDGEVDDNTTLDDIYTKFNVGKKPEDFTGHGLSVSDVVYMGGKFYYCDSFGWEEITFPTEEAKKQHTITVYAGLLHFAKNGNLMHGKVKVGTWFVDNIWEKRGGRRDRSGNLTVEKMYYAKLDGYDRSYFGYTRKDLKSMLEGKQAKITLNTITFRPEDVPQEVA